jgi:hypothetical protein
VSAADVRDVINVSSAEVPDAKVLKMVKRAEVTLELETETSIDYASCTDAEKEIIVVLAAIYTDQKQKTEKRGEFAGDVATAKHFYGFPPCLATLPPGFWAGCYFRFLNSMMFSWVQTYSKPAFVSALRARNSKLVVLLSGILNREA